MEISNLIISGCDLDSIYTKAIGSKILVIADGIYLSFVLKRIDVAEKLLSIKPRELLYETIINAMINEDTDTINILLTYGSPNWYLLLQHGVSMNCLEIIDYSVRYLNEQMKFAHLR